MDDKKKLNKNETEEVTGGERPHIPMLVLRSYCCHCKTETVVDSSTIKTENRWVWSSTFPGRMPYDVQTRTCTVCGKQTEWVGNQMLHDGIL